MYYIIFCILAILVLSALIGLKRGLFKTLFGFLALALSIGVTYFARPYVSAFIIEYTEVDDYIEEKIYKKIETDTQKNVAESLKDSGVTTDLSKLTLEETKYILENDPDKATQVAKIDGLNLPEYMKDLYIANNNDSVYEKIGVSTFYRYMAKYTAHLVVNAISFFATFIAIRLVLFLISLIIMKAMDEEPALSALDRFSGMLLGLAVGIGIVWIFMIIASLAFGSEFDEMIAGNRLIQLINDYNILLKVITS
ncbi:MAG: CvpA family protein [Eubacterium sp.]|nr:CvpA family protein [Eubacterium sp.]